jgi:hypothetical protein
VVDGGSCVGGDGIGFGMEFVILDAVDADRLEGSQADVQSDVNGLDAALADSGEGFRGEVKAGGRGGYRSRLLGIDGLIALAIAGRIGAGDVGWERDVADAIESGEEVVVLVVIIVLIVLIVMPGGLKADVALAELGAGQNLGLKVVALTEEQVFAYADLAAGANQAFPIVRIGGELAGQQNLDAAVEEVAGRRIVRADRLSAGAFTATIEPGGKNAGVVEDYEIAGPQQVRKVAEQGIGIAAGGALQVQHARTVTGGEGFLGDEFVGKVEMEIGNQHGVRL